MAAWRTGHRPGTTPQQWGMARVNSYIGKGKGTYYGADSDLSGKGKKKKESVGEAAVKEISKKTAANYIGKASRDAYFKGRDQGTVDAISAVGGTHPHQDYKKSPERKAAMRMRGIDRATKRLAKNEDKVSDAERKAMDAFMKKGKMKKLPPGKAAGYHGKSDPGSSMKGMISPADTKQFGTKKKVGSMK